MKTPVHYRTLLRLAAPDLVPKPAIVGYNYKA